MQIQSIVFLLLINGTVAGSSVRGSSSLRGMFNSNSWTNRHLSSIVAVDSGRHGGSGNSQQKSKGKDGKAGKENQMSSAHTVNPTLAPTAMPTGTPMPIDGIPSDSTTAPVDPPSDQDVPATTPAPVTSSPVVQEPTAAPSNRPSNPFPTAAPSPSFTTLDDRSVDFRYPYH